MQSEISAVAQATAASGRGGLRFVWLEVTGKCQLRCGHCYAESGPDGTHGLMRVSDWRRVIEQAAALGAGMVQFIGGEPTLYPDLRGLIEHALAQDVRVEVYTNLANVPERLWEAFVLPGVSLATSWYSDDPVEHAGIVGGSTRAYWRTLANIGLAVGLGIPVRAGLISFSDQQRVEQARAQLARLGIVDTGVDHVRGVGRGAAGQQPNVNALCGQCADGKLAILPTGDAYPCVFSRWPQMLAGNVRQQTLEQIVTGTPLTTTRTQLQTAFGGRTQRDCQPPPCRRTDGNQCRPDACRPDVEWSVTSCQPPCAPDDLCGPQNGCTPHCAPLGGCQPGACDPA